MWLVECSALPVLRQKDFLPPLTEFQGIWDIQMVRWEEMVVLVWAPQLCTIQSRMPPGVLCRAVQEFHMSCLAA